MAFVKDIVLTFEVSPGNWQPILCARDAELTIQTNTLKSTDTDQGKFDSVIPVSNSGSLTVSTLLQIDSAFNSIDVARLQLNLTPIRVRYAVVDLQGNEIAYFEANAVIQSSSFAGSVFQLLENSHTFTLSGIIELNES